MSGDEEQITFDQMGLRTEILSAVSQLGYTEPTPIQRQSIPHLIEGSDLIGQAQTGTGKTAAFALPILGKIDKTIKTPQALVLVPTRELATQVCEAFSEYARELKGLRLLPVYGGQGMAEQLRVLKRGCHIIVGTPGRLIDHLERGSLKLDALTTLVIDEADELLRMGFIEEVTSIIERTPTDRQTVLFSATMPGAIAKIAKRHMKSPIEIRVKTKKQTADAVDQFFIPITGGYKKIEALARILECEDHDGVIVFVRTRNSTVEVAEALEKRGIGAAFLNGDMSQPQREQTVDKFKSGAFDVMVCTDVAARGLDVPRISHVVNFDIPYDTEAYVHRIGRTGRAGRSGKAILFAGRNDQKRLQAIERQTRTKIEQIRVPTHNEVRQKRIEAFQSTVVKTLELENLDGFLEFVEQVKTASGESPERIASALAFMAQGGRAFDVEKMSIEDKTRKAPQRERGRRNDDRKRPIKSDIEAKRNLAKAVKTKDMSTFRVEVGAQQGVEPKHLVGAISNEIGIASKHIGAIRIASDYSVIELPSGMPDELLKHLKKVWLGGRQLDMTELGPATPQRKKASSRKARRAATAEARNDGSKPARKGKKDAQSTGNSKGGLRKFKRTTRKSTTRKK